MSKLIGTGSLSQELKGVCPLVALVTPGPKQDEGMLMSSSLKPGEQAAT